MGSPIDSEFGWKDWCENEEMFLDRFNHYIKFTLEEGSQILQINYEDVKYFDDLDYIKKYITTANVLNTP